MAHACSEVLGATTITMQDNGETQVQKCEADYRRLLDGYSSTYVAEWAEHRQCLTTGHNAIHARKPFKSGDIICDFGHHALLDHPTYLTLQVSDHKHLEFKPQWLEYINHSCDPNVLFNASTLKLEVVRGIQQGDELCFFYPATEWSMISPFNCRCGTRRCIGYVAGAAHLNRERLLEYRLTDYIANRMDERDANNSAGSPSTDSS